MLMPKQGVFPMHCSANIGETHGDSAVFFGLSGTGKTTLSADPNRKLIGDDEHGWADDSIFNFEGGCYAKCIDLTEEREPEIYHAIKFGTLVENVVMDEETRESDLRRRLPHRKHPRRLPRTLHPQRCRSPASAATPKAVIFLTADAYGVMPPISRLDEKQAMYYFVSGFTSKLAGTERGVTAPVPTFSTCFGAPFMPHGSLRLCRDAGRRRSQKAGAKVYLVNTGWNGTGKRMKLSYTRAMVTAALTGEIEKSEFVTDPYLRRTGADEHPAQGVPERAAHPRQHVGRQRRLCCELQEAGRELCRELQEVHPHERRGRRRRPQGVNAHFPAEKQTERGSQPLPALFSPRRTAYD